MTFEKSEPAEIWTLREAAEAWRTGARVARFGR